MGKASWFGEPSGSFFQNIGPDRGNGFTALQYINRVLRLHIVPYFDRHQHHMFQQDNARDHTARAIRDFLQQHNIRSMPWPALSPSLIPIEHLWAEIQRKLNEVRPKPITAADLKVVFLRIRAAIPMVFINRLIHSMYRRCMSLVNDHGDTRGIDL